MKILVRVPNWLGDMVMSTALIRMLRNTYPSAEIDVIVKKGLDTLAALIPGINRRYVFSKQEWKGLGGAYRFGKMIRRQVRYDLFFCLPDSFSSALMSWGTRAKQRVGFKKELRSIFLTRSFKKPHGLHRVEEYTSLLEKFTNNKTFSPSVELNSDAVMVADRIIINFNSEAESRRMPVEKAASVLKVLINAMPGAEFILIGSAKEKAHIDAILSQVSANTGIKNEAGQTKTVFDLAKLIGTGSVVFTTDSGPAHIANALGVPVVVTFGAGNENNTAPYNKEGLIVLRLGQLPCEPCIKNYCKFGLPKCLELLEVNRIIEAVKKLNRS